MVLGRLDETAAAQEGVVSRAQLRAIGVSRHAIRSQLRARRWIRAGARVVVLQTGSLTRRQRWWVAVLHAGPRSALHGHTAAEAGGLRGWERRAVHVIVPKGTHVPPLNGVVVHESRRLGPAELHPAHEPKRIRIARAAVEAASAEPTARVGCALLAAVVQQRLASAEQLRAQLDSAGPVRGRQLLLHALDDISGGAQSLSEIDFVRLCRRAGLPAPEQQAVRTDAQGRRRYLDAVWRRRDGRSVIAEVDGALHLLASTWWDDMARQNELAIGSDAIILRFPSVVIRSDEWAVAGQIGRALGLSVRSRRR